MATKFVLDLGILKFNSSHCTLGHKTKQKNWDFATNADILIPISLQPDGVNLWYIKFGLLDLT